MANQKLTALTEDTTPSTTDIVYSVKAPGGTPLSRKVTHANLAVEGTSIRSTGEAGGTKFLREDGDGTSSWQAVAGGRETLAANRTYYVRTDGNDSNTGLVDSAGGAFLTLPAAATAVGTLDISIYSVTIQVRDGTYTDGVILPNVVGWATASQLNLVGNTTTPANCVISATSEDCILSAPTCTWNVSGFKLQTTTGGDCVNSSGGKLTLSNMDYGASASNHINIDNGNVEVLTDYSISGSATTCHVFVTNSSVAFMYNHTVTFLADVTWGYCFLYDAYVSAATIASMTYTLGAFTATGTRYVIQLNAACQTNGGGANYFPGNAAGSTATGGQYA